MAIFILLKNLEKCKVSKFWQEVCEGNQKLVKGLRDLIFSSSNDCNGESGKALRLHYMEINSSRWISPYNLWVKLWGMDGVIDQGPIFILFSKHYIQYIKHKNIQFPSNVDGRGGPKTVDTTHNRRQNFQIEKS